MRQETKDKKQDEKEKTYVLLLRANELNEEKKLKQAVFEKLHEGGLF
jgi:hypothetical protein